MSNLKLAPTKLDTHYNVIHGLFRAIDTIYQHRFESTVGDTQNRILL